MAPSPSFPFTNTYQAYKKHTANIAIFLHETVIQIGHEKYKCNKTRKAVSNKALQPLLRVSQFIEYAKIIQMQARAPVEIPETIITDLEEALNLRKQVTAFYDSIVKERYEVDTNVGGSKSGAMAMDGHSYFIGVLERVLELLRPMDTDLKGKPSIGKDNQARCFGESYASEVQQISNRFVSLTLHEPDERDNRECGTEKLEDDNTEAQMQDDIEMEKQLAAFCLFKDIAIIRSYIEEVWTKYKNNKEDGTDLMTVSLVTNTAIDLVKRMDEEFRKNFPEIKDYQDMVAHAIFPIAMRQHQQINEAAVSFYEWYATTPEWWKVSQTETDWLLIRPWRVLEYFMRHCQPGSVVSHSHREREHGSKIDVSLWKNVKGDRRLLLDVLVELHARATIAVSDIDRDFTNILCIDETINGMVERIQTGQAKLWFVFALRLYVHIHNILGDKLLEPFQELQCAALSFKESLNLVLQDTSTKKLFKKDTGCSARLGIHEVVKFIDRWALHDYFHFITLERAKEKGTPPALTEEFSLQKKHPVMCGNTLFGITIFARNVGLGLCCHWGTLNAPIHLYNAVYQSGELKVRWPDMERVMQIHECNRIFRGSRPNTKQECYDRFYSVIEAQHLHPGFDLRDISPIIDTFSEKYYKRKFKSTEWNIRKVELIVKASQAGKNRKRDNRAENGTSVVSLLKSLQNLMIVEVPKLRFDYTSFHRRNYRMLEALREALREDVILQLECVEVTDEEVTFMNDDTSLAWIVFWILKHTAMFDIIVKHRRKLDRSYTRTHCRFYAKTAKVMKEFIDREGDVEIRKVDGVYKTTSSGQDMKA